MRPGSERDVAAQQTVDMLQLFEGSMSNAGAVLRPISVQ